MNPSITRDGAIAASRFPRSREAIRSPGASAASARPAQSTRDATAPRARIPLLVVAAGAIGAALALGIQAEMTRATVPATTSALAVPRADEHPVVAPIADPVDWSKVELSPDPGPLAIAAYGP